ncbi:MAG: hypothetical protein KatS3mg103_1170 [Phycisphaerales bacterium]|nr:MAG: hypothetical protein KatS3mg103_1170 [Phycisphaerales bacterium]
MHIEINYANIEPSDALEAHLHEKLHRALGRFEDHLTRIEAYLADENSPTKDGGMDKRCTLEARPKGKDPIAVEAHADDFFAAVDAAVGKLERALTHRLERD